MLRIRSFPWNLARHAAWLAECTNRNGASESEGAATQASINRKKGETAAPFNFFSLVDEQDRDVLKNVAMATAAMAAEHYDRPSRWGTPMEMFGSLLAGIALAVGHDQFYRRLDGTFVTGGDGLDGNVSPVPQEWVIRIGTAFAFLVKTFLVAAACVAYSQRMWHNLKTNEFQIRQIDSLTSVLVNIFSFWHLRLWGRVPVLALIGLAVW